jgi:hypothetical protein
MTHLLPPGPLIIGLKKQSSYMTNGRKKVPSMRTIVADSTKHSELKTITRNTLPPKEDIIWMLMQSAPPTTLKKRKQS